ncbi:MAG: ABC transporter substrate-binding protein [Alphaproteobacteria bacterium]|nr:ABC transporter substrate-binding protein [Alphaproteobacteria bacterium]
MKKKEKKFWIVIGMLAFFAGAFGTFNKRDVGGGKPVVKIGAILSLTGDVAHVGQAAKRGIELAIEDVNKNPDNKFIYRAIFEDHRMEARLGAPLATKMILNDRVHAIIPQFSASARAAAPMVVQNRIIGLNAAPVADVLDGVYNFTLFNDAEINVAAISKFINSKNPKRVVLALQNSGAAQEMTVGLRSQINAEVRDFTINVGDRDFKTVARQIKQWNPDLIFLFTMSPELELFIREMRLQGIEGTKVGFDLINGVGMQPFLEGFYIVSQSLGNEEFFERFGSQATLYSPYFYDAVMVYADAVERAGSVEAEAVSAEIHKLGSFEGALGHVKISPRGAFQSQVVVYKFENGRLITVKE